MNSGNFDDGLPKTLGDDDLLELKSMLENDEEELRSIPSLRKAPQVASNSFYGVGKLGQKSFYMKPGKGHNRNQMGSFRIHKNVANQETPTKISKLERRMKDVESGQAKIQKTLEKILARLEKST